MADDINKINEVIVQFDEKLDKYEKELNIPQKFPEVVKNITTQILEHESDVSKFTADESLDRAYKLSQYSFFLQKQINKENARIHFLNDEIEKLINPRLGQVLGSTFDERKKRAISENPAASSMFQVKNILERRVLRLSFLAGKIDRIQDILMQIYNRRKYNNG